jgi:hypothetical protein
MMTCPCKLLLLVVAGLILGGTMARGQVRKLISGTFQDLTIDQFVHEIETRSDYHFFYSLSKQDSFRINLTVTAEPLDSVLYKVFEHTDFHYAIDDQNNVFLTRKLSIETSLPADFFSQGNRNAGNAGLDSALEPANPGEGKTGKLKSTLENRLFEIGNRTNGIKPGNSTIAGYIRDVKTGESISGAAVYIDNPPIGVTTDQYGYFSFTLPRGRHVIKISSVGMKNTSRQVMLYGDGRLNIDMEEFVPSLKVITVLSEKNSNVKRSQMGVEKLDIKTIKQVPVVFGEVDVLRAVLTLPGVTSVGEASTGFNVRGSSSDENLILFNDATIFNPTHFFGFFSAFNPDVVKDVELYKSSIPEKFGGRLASVLDITTNDGNKKKLSGVGGIGPLTARLTIDGPIGGDKTTFVAGARTTYSDWILRAIPNSGYENSSASFYDLNLNLTHEFDSKNSLFLTGYLSHDQFRLNSDTLYKYSNKNLNLRWNHHFSNKLFLVTTVGYDGYDYSISSNDNPVNAYNLSFAINQAYLKANMTYAAGSDHLIDFGISSNYYMLQSGSYQPQGGKSLVVPDKLQPEKALESAVYLGDRFTITPRLSLNAGIRYSLFNYLGPHDVYSYAPGLPREVSTITDTTSYGPGKLIKTYQGLDYRASLRYTLTDNSSVKGSYNTLTQFTHVLSNTTSISPTDVWKLSDPNIKPEYGDQFSIGYYHDFKSHTIETSLEVYYKRLHNYLDYKNGAILIMNPHIETDVLTTRGKAYGAEFMIKKLTGKLNGWLSYTYSRTLLQQDDPLAGQTINNGDFYPANFDRPNNLNLVGNYKLSHRLSFSLNFSYSTGRPITLPVAIYDLAGSQRVYYSDRNQYRIPDYFRTDLAMNIEGNHKIKKFKHSSWTLGVYNLTARKNPYSVYFVEENGVIKGYQLSIFGTAIPYITYNFRF